MSWSEAQKRYANSEKGKTARRKYQTSERGRAARAAYMVKHKTKLAESKQLMTVVDSPKSKVELAKTSKAVKAKK